MIAGNPLVSPDRSTGDEGQFEEIAMFPYLSRINVILVEPRAIKRGMIICIPDRVTETLVDTRIEIGSRHCLNRRIE